MDNGSKNAAPTDIASENVHNHILKAKCDTHIYIDELAYNDGKGCNYRSPYPVYSNIVVVVRNIILGCSSPELTNDRIARHIQQQKQQQEYLQNEYFKN